MKWKVTEREGMKEIKRKRRRTETERRSFAFIAYPNYITNESLYFRN